MWINKENVVNIPNGILFRSKKNKILSFAATHVRTGGHHVR
jgi:hypothetical protein